jgi:hypothetical protein
MVKSKSAISKISTARPLSRRAGLPDKTFACHFVEPGPAVDGATLPDVLDCQITIATGEGQFFAYLTSTDLPALEFAMQEGYRLELSKPLLSCLRQCVLVDEQGYPQSGLTFCTHYTDDPQLIAKLSPTLATSGEDAILFASGQVVLRTVLAWDGDVIQQVCEAHLRHPACMQITTAHHWILGQLMQQLRLGATAPIDLIIDILPPILVLGTVIMNLGHLTSSPGGAMRWIGLSCLSFLLPLGKRQLKAFVWRSLSAAPPTVTGKVVRWMLGHYWQ